ncbi:hypothetical protein FB567DRAFT_619273 [Paraphoma chrysanthemicola]|uniref:Uncharacterized protein n=1 Tax=Paraphoma chrysanthemicola TaxID=798071 RepID=A0A8K0W064_9PLEO|nr:hypothetical protein FB567DRAFT_619273 [Paraphoma chrysanthemicola]
MQHVHTKAITMSLNRIICSATITSAMTNDNDIYAALRNAFKEDLAPDDHIIIYHPDRDEKILLAYTTLKAGVLYRVERASKRAQGAGHNSGANRKIVTNIAEIMKHWALSDDTDILPVHISPPGAPTSWSRSLTDSLRSLSGWSKLRQEFALRFLVEEVEGRRARDDEAPGQVTAGDVKRAVKRMQQYIAAEASEMVREDEVYAGDLGKAVEEAAQEGKDSGLVGWEYEQDGRFKIASFRGKGGSD